MSSPDGRTEIRITGFGGQGVVLAGHIIGRACAIEGDLDDFSSCHHVVAPINGGGIDGESSAERRRLVAVQFALGCV